MERMEQVRVLSAASMDSHDDARQDNDCGQTNSGMGKSSRRSPHHAGPRCDWWHGRRRVMPFQVDAGLGSSPPALESRISQERARGCRQF